MSIALPSRKLILLGGSRIPSWVPVAGAVTATLFADFTKGNYWYNGLVYPSFATWNAAIGGTFSRASSATYLQGGVIQTGSSGVARFPADISGTPTGIRLTGAGTNLQVQSNSFANAAWNSAAATLASGQSGPDGTASGWLVTANAGSNIYNLYGTGQVVSASTVYTTLAFAKYSNNPWLWVRMDQTGVNPAWVAFNLQTGASGNKLDVGSTISAYGINPLANGWYLVWATWTPTASGACNIAFTAGSGSTPTGGSIVQAGTEAFVLFGSQITPSAFPLDYIPTTSSTVTQAADSYSFPFTQTAFTAFAKTTSLNKASGGAPIFGLNTNNAPIYVGGAPGANSLTTWNGSVNLSVLTLFNGAAPGKYATSGNGSGRSIALNGGGLNSDAGAMTSSAPSTMTLGGAFSATFYGDMAQVGLWNGVVGSSADLDRLSTLP